MKCLKVFIVAIVLCMPSLVFGDDKIDPQPAPITNSSTTSTTTTTTTSKPTTKTTTVAPTTTTVDPKTTTTAPTTTSSTTAAPNTTTTTEKPAPPTPTPAPGPVPEPNVTNWAWNYTNTNRSCLLGQAAIQFELLKPNSNASLKVNLPNNTQPTGHCDGTDEEELNFSWGDNNTVVITFKKTNSSKYEIQSITSDLNVTWPNSTAPQLLHLVHTKPEFETALTNSYKCVRLQTLDLTEENSNVTAGYLHVSHLQYQAFRNETGTKFDSAWDCDGVNTPDIVPVVVGCVLAVLVVLVLVAYLFGRRRCHARGYLSMFAETGKTDSDYIPMKNLSCFN